MYSNGNKGKYHFIDPAQTDFDDFQSDDLGEYEAISETALTRESGSKVGLIDEKTDGRKSLASVPFRI
jgi:hypothetical protein